MRKVDRHFQEPTKAQLALKPGDKVVHFEYGEGWIKEEWGAWFSCRECFMPYAWCSHTGRKALVSGAGIFEVEFPKETKAINCVWLQPL